MNNKERKNESVATGTVKLNGRSSEMFLAIHIKGVLEDLLPGGITHIQNADDTVIMIDGSATSITNLKLILYCFEWLTGLKINYLHLAMGCMALEFHR